MADLSYVRLRVGFNRVPALFLICHHLAPLFGSRLCNLSSDLHLFVGNRLIVLLIDQVEIFLFSKRVCLS